MGELKCAVAKTTPREEFCIPTCNVEVLVKRRKNTSMLLEVYFNLLGICQSYICYIKDN